MAVKKRCPDPFVLCHRGEHKSHRGEHNKCTSRRQKIVTLNGIKKLVYAGLESARKFRQT